MTLSAPVARTIRTIADWLDDRLTIAAIGLATGYFGLSDAQWASLTSLIVAFATTVLVLVPDPRKSEIQSDEPTPSAPPLVVGRAVVPDGGVRAAVPPDGGDPSGNGSGWNG